MVRYKIGSSIRKADYPVNKIFLDRWSPRAMGGEKISKKELMTLFEAARWAPSSSNNQPWRFVYANNGSKHWKKFFDLLVEFNQMWAKNASVLVCLCTKKTNKEGKPDRNHMSDAGAAWENLALQASLMGLVCHGMGGYDVAKARKVLKVPKDHEVVHMFTLGRPGKLTMINERMRKNEVPNSRNKVKDFVFEGSF